jgi:hypothetical protein
MEVREILVANTKTQKRSKVTTDATTLGELKAALTAAGVDYSGMTFTEGISKTQLLDDATQLPQNVMYKGQATNNLVILLTNTKKNIASGMGTRAEAYSILKANNLQDDIKDMFGRNFTQVPTTDLWLFIEDHTDNTEGEDDEDYEDDYDDEDMDDTDSDDDYSYQSSDEVIAESIINHIKALVDTNAIGYSVIKTIINSLDCLKEDMLNDNEEEGKASESVSASDGSINDSDIDNMINEMNI